MIALRTSGATSSDVHTQILAIRTSQQTRISAVLTSDQLPKYQALIAAQKTPQRSNTPTTSGAPQ
jgi:hypothetical protein